MGNFFLQDDSVKQTAQLMYQMALMESGFMLNNSNDSASRTYSSVKSRLSISPDATIFEEEDDVEEAEVETETKEATSTTEAEPAKNDDEDTEPSAVKDELEIT
ncbi:hypothetical protein OIU78_012843 [Salix suchowensis]|nr:hypothetical protein OIU78_012843 [Salix suchowensis]